MKSSFWGSFISVTAISMRSGRRINQAAPRSPATEPLRQAAAVIHSNPRDPATGAYRIDLSTP